MVENEEATKREELIQLARNYWHTDGQIEIDEEPMVSFTEHGAYIEAWVYVSYPKKPKGNPDQVEMFSTSKGD